MVQGPRALGRVSGGGYRVSVRISTFVALIFTYLFNIFFLLFLYIGSILIGDLIISTIFFIFTGNWTSVLQMLLNYSLIEATFLRQEIWKISTDLIGLNYLVNEFIALQYSPTGRWIMFGISFFLFIVFFLAGAWIFDKDFLEDNDGPAALAMLTVILIVAPLQIGLLLAIAFYAGQLKIFS